MIAEVRAEVVSRLQSYSAANDDVFGQVLGAMPRFAPEAAAITRFPATMFELYPERGDDGAWHDYEYGLRLYTLLVLSEAAFSRTGDDDPGDPVLKAQLRALPGNANDISVIWDGLGEIDEEDLQDLIRGLAPQQATHMLGVTSSFRVIEAGAAA